MNRRFVILVSASLALSAASAAIAPLALADPPRMADNWAEDRRRPERQPQQVQQPQQPERKVDLNRVSRELRSRYGGDLISADRFGDRVQIRWDAEDGRLLVIEVDAQTGRIISVRG